MNDDLLKPYLAATSPKDAERILNRLAQEYLRPLISRVVGYELGRVDEDVVQNALIAVTERIRKNRGDEPEEPIRSLKGYTVLSARNEARKRCGERSDVSSLERMKEDTGQEPEAPHADPEALVAGRETLQSIWCEIQKLRPNQCAVLLLDWKEISGGAVRLFEGMGIASLEEMAAAMKMAPRQLASLPPWADQQIAATLGTTVKTVRTCRNKARILLRSRLGNMLQESDS